jgi:8-oxo-dGTP pyrophosphatase MutT (NUDIX family)
MQLAVGSSEPPFTEATLRSRAGRALLASPAEDGSDPDNGLGHGPSDFDLNPELISELSALPRPRAAAVLVPIVARPLLTVILTQRTESLSSHAGQIAFPGGKIEAGETPLDAALREAHEEIGLERRYVEPLGYLDPYRTGTGFRIIPIVGLVQPDVPLRLDPSEVADAFEVPLGFLMDAANHELHARVIGGRERRFYAMPYEGRFIWGATAGIIRNMHERLVNA